MDLEKDNLEPAKRSEVHSEPPRAFEPPLGDEPPREKQPMSFDSWAAEPAPRRSAPAPRETFDTDTIKVILILAGLTAGMVFALKSLF